MAKLFVFGIMKQGDSARSPFERFGIKPKSSPLSAVVYGYTLFQWQGSQYPLARPALYDKIGPKLIQGEVIELWDDEPTWRRIDALEGRLAGRFTRETVNYHAEGGKTGAALMYVATAEALYSYPHVEIGSFFSKLAHV